MSFKTGLDDGEDWPRPSPLRLAGRVELPWGAAGLGLSMAAYAASFAAPYEPGARGYGIFLTGLLYCWYVPITFAWWANPLYWYALATGCRGDWPKCSALAAGSTLLGCSFLLLMRSPIGPAYLLWVGSMAILAAHAALVAAVGGRRERRKAYPSDLFD